MASADVTVSCTFLAHSSDVVSDTTPSQRRRSKPAATSPHCTSSRRAEPLCLFLRFASGSSKAVCHPQTSGDIHLKFVLLIHIISIKRQITLICIFLYTGPLFITNVVYTMDMEHGFIISRLVIIRDISHDEWTHTSCCPCGPVHIGLLGSRLLVVNGRAQIAAPEA